VKEFVTFHIKSTNIKSIGYNATARTLQIQFKQGSAYNYIGVEPEVFQQFLTSKSAGKFFHSNIRNKYIGKKIEKN